MNKNNNNNIEPTKSLHEAGFSEVESVKVEPVETKYPTIKKMIAKLDKFLDKRIAVIGIIYIMALIAGGAGLITNGVTTQASSEGSGGAMLSDTNIWIYSLLGVVTFVFLLILVRVVAIRTVRARKVTITE